MDYLKMDYFKWFIALIGCVGMLCLSGCSGSNSGIGAVTGTVTIDGEPVEYAAVSFMPVEGRASIGRTDANGVYNLAYVKNQKGAVIGQHKVTITTKVVAETNYGQATYNEGGAIKQDKKAKQSAQKTGRKEMLPKKYCDRNSTELTASVEKGNNTIDFDLTTTE